MTAIPLTYAAGHMFVDLPEGRWLVDTGSPVTFGRSGTITWAGERHRIPDSFGSITPEHIQPHIDVPFVGLIGVDLLNAADSCWDGPAGEFRIGDVSVPPTAVNAAMPSLMGVPVLDLHIGGLPARCIFDTGARFGYVLHQRFTAHAVEQGRIRDFSPIVGEIDSPSWIAEIDLRGVRFTEQFGFLGGLGGAALSLMNVDGIVGCSWLPTRRIWYRASIGTLGIS
jgi:hypothetical protein